MLEKLSGFKWRIMKLFGLVCAELFKSHHVHQIKINLGHRVRFSAFNSQATTKLHPQATTGAFLQHLFLVYNNRVGGEMEEKKK